MNGAEPKIEVLKPFSDAIELTKQILFRPFDLKKWFVIGFAAWLAHIGGGSNFNFRSNYQYDRRTGFHRVPAFQWLTEAVHRTPWWTVIFAITVLIVLVVALCVLFAWLRARGRFMFIDCIVRDRAAIGEPWREFRQLGNSFFFLSLLVGIGFLLIGAIVAVPLIFLIGQRHHHPEYNNVFLLCLILAAAVVIFVLGIAWLLISHLMIPIMYRRRILAWTAVREVVYLIDRYPDAITLYCLFWIVLGIGSAIIGCVAICLTCCIAAIPYIGTVILLPLYTCLRAFGLLYLKQFGPDYDVWAALPQAVEPMAPPPPPLPTG